ncbi:hypothetical protein EV426DRAFT_608361 [Tirmania nivea]|nr:hypothetical protein EV426DRAFT_608361 [Tirmania nivea]
MPPISKSHSNLLFCILAFPILHARCCLLPLPYHETFTRAMTKNQCKPATSSGVRPRVGSEFPEKAADGDTVHNTCGCRANCLIGEFEHSSKSCLTGRCPPSPTQHSHQT